MKKQLRNVLLLIIPFLLMILINESVRPTIEEKPSATISDIYIFKTPPFASDQESFQNYMVALYSVAYMIKMTLKNKTNPPKSYIELCLK